jgi:hypothetical protein
VRVGVSISWYEGTDMGTYLKQNEVEGPKKSKKSGEKKQSPQRPITTYERVCEMDRREPTNFGGIEYALESLADNVGRYVQAAESDEHNTLAVFTGEPGSGYYPVLIALEPSDTMDRIIESLERTTKAFERIADALAAKLV